MALIEREPIEKYIFNQSHPSRTERRINNATMKKLYVVQLQQYFRHLLANWRVAMHAANDFAEHFIHGLIPWIEWRHSEAHNNYKSGDVKGRIER